MDISLVYISFSICREIRKKKPVINGKWQTAKISEKRIEKMYMDGERIVGDFLYIMHSDPFT